MEDVAVKIPSSWYYFGICLGVKVGKLKAIEQHYPHDHLKCFSEVYSVWEEENLKPLTWEIVVRILRNEVVEQKYLSLLCDAM